MIREIDNYAMLINTVKFIANTFPNGIFTKEQYNKARQELSSYQECKKNHLDGLPACFSTLCKLFEVREVECNSVKVEHTKEMMVFDGTPLMTVFDYVNLSNIAKRHLASQYNTIESKKLTFSELIPAIACYFDDKDIANITVVKDSKKRVKDVREKAVNSLEKASTVMNGHVARMEKYQKKVENSARLASNKGEKVTKLKMCIDIIEGI